MTYLASSTRYDAMEYRRCGKSGLKLPIISLGLWQNFGGVDIFENGRKIICEAFDAGITHIDLANNYGPPYGSAEENFGKILSKDLNAYRDELIISTKAGYDMWDGPYGNWGSKKYLVASLDQSLKRMGLDYVDIFYHHRPDPETPLEETMEALAQIVRQGKALYVGLSNYKAEQTKSAVSILKQLGVRCLIHQPKYSMFERWTENDRLYDVLEQEGIGAIAFSPLAQGLLTNKYLTGIPSDSRAALNRYLKSEQITESKIEKVKGLNELALNRGQSLAQMALAWVVRTNNVTSVLIGASRVEQLKDNIGFINNRKFSQEELNIIEEILRSEQHSSLVSTIV